jgi:uracil-DNA glycosylase
LRDAYVTAAVKCAPPDNKPAVEERDSCQPFLLRELAALTRLRVILCLGGFGWDAALRALRAMGSEIPRPMPRFGHEATARVGELALVGSYHPSQQNTFTGRLTEPMLDRALQLARSAAERSV